MAKVSNAKTSTKTKWVKGEHWKKTDAYAAAQAKYEGMTRREYNAKHSKFAKLPEKSAAGSFLFVGHFDNNPAPQTTNFPNEASAVARLIRLLPNSNLISGRVIRADVIYQDDKPVGTRDVVILSVTKNNQEFCNSKTVTLWKDGNSLVNMKSIKGSPRLTAALQNGTLEVHSHKAEGGQAWWEQRNG